MLKRKFNWALTSMVVCAGLWCCLSPRTTDAASGGKAVQITVVGAEGKPLSGAHVQFLRPGGKSFDATMTSKDTWLLKDADGKVTVSVRDGREGGTIELTLPANAAEMVSYVVSVSGTELRAEVVSGFEAPSAPTKPELNIPQLQQSTRSEFSEANRSATHHKGPSASTSNSTVKEMAFLAPPANDNCIDAIPVGPLPASVIGSNVDATDDAGSPSCGVSTGPFKNIWYTVVGTGAQITLSTCNAGTDNGTGNFDTKISVFCNDCADKICVGGNDDAASPACSPGNFRSRFTFCSEVGRTYLVTVGGFNAAEPTGTIQLDVTAGAACSTPPVCQRPSNDTCENAIPVGTLPASVTGQVGAALNNTITPCGFSAIMHKDIWYSVVGTGGTLTASTCNAGTVNSTANYDTKLSVFCADCANLSCVGGNDDAAPACALGSLKSTFSWCSEAGRTYYIAVGNFSATTPSGAIQLTVTDAGGTCSGAPNCGPPVSTCSAGETCATASVISSLPFNHTGDTCGCLNDYDSVCPFTGSTAKDAVYSYTPSSDQCVSISLCNGSNYDTKVYVYDNVCTGSTIACNDDACTSPNFPSPYVSRLDSVSLTAGHTYYIVVDGYNAECGNYVLNVNQIACPAPCGVCPPGGIAENEPNCSTVNGGCNSVPPVFSPVACGQTICGTSVWDGSTRDTDWYQVTFAADTQFVWSVQAEFAVVIGMVATSPLGNPDCATATALDPFAVGASCGVASVTRCVPPGTYWFFVAPDFNGPTFTCGADYTASLSCVGCTPPTCTGDTCATAMVIPSTPFSDTGDTCICNDNYDEICPYNASGSPDKVYVYTPSANECVDISMCAGSAYDTKVYVYQGSCGAYQSGTAIACNDDSCSTPNFGAPYVSSVTGVNLIGGQTYYIVVDGYGGDCGDYTIDIGPCCEFNCSPGSTPENEANCGIPDDTVNGGCNSAQPVFSPLTCGQHYCGTAAFDGSLRDTDWYQVTVGTSTRFTWTATSEFPSLTGPVPTSPAGTGNCAELVGVIEPALFGVPCTPGSVVTECLPAGTYWFFMAPTFASPVACGAEYEVGLSCEPCVIPLGACCRPNGSCEDGIAEAACQNWQGDGTLCSGVTCPQPPANDNCDQAITVAIPSVTAGSTALSTFDTGLPATCGTSITTAGVWYKVIGNGNTITVDTCNGATSYDSKISVFCPNCQAPACVTGNDDFCGLQSSASWCSAPGETYLILVHGFGGATGPFELTVTNGAPCSNPPSCEAVGICGGGGDCCVAGSGPGCNNVTCCESVCGCDPFCCDVEWDVNCAGPNAFVPGCSAADLCSNCGSGPASGGCCRGSVCTIQTQAECLATVPPGNYLGDNTTCAGPDVPGNSYTDSPGVAIPDGPAGTVSDTMDVPDSFTIADLNVDLGITHTWVGDLVITITHNATSVIIVDQPGVPASTFGCGEDNLLVIVDDEGQGGSMENTCQANLTSPPNYTPNNPLSAFDGMNAQGTWTITVTDSAGFDTGTLDSWSLHFGTPGPSPCVASGACCLSPTTCIITSPEACTGTYLGNNTNCSAAGPVTVYSADPNATIPDAPASPPGAVGTPITNVINVPDSFTLADVDIDLVVTHTWVGDLIVSITHNAMTVVIVDRAGYAGTGFGCGSDNYNVIVDDQGTGGTIEALCGTTTTPISPPNYTPNNPLSVFNGMDAAGAWTITVNDNANLDTGTLNHWSLHLTRPGQGPCANIAICGNGIVEAGEECDGGACCTDCHFASAGTSCRPSAGVCDVAETCSGSSATCPPDGFSSGECRPSTGPCDPAEVCPGNGPACPPNVLVTSCISGDGCCPAGCNNVSDNDCAAICGNGVAEAGEECDGSSGVCESGVCLTDCTCEPVPTTDIPTMSEWGLAVLALLLLIGAKLYFGRREATA